MTSHLCINTYTSPGQDVLKLELCFVGQDFPRVPAILGTTYGAQARRLDLSFNTIRSLSGLERFSRLEELVLDNNRLTDEITWPPLPHLTTLSLNKNLFCNASVLLQKLQRSCPLLRYLSLLNNWACPDQLSEECAEHDYRAYRLMVLQYLPRLRFLDSRRVRRREREEALSCGKMEVPTLCRRGTAASLHPAGSRGTPAPLLPPCGKGDKHPVADILTGYRRFLNNVRTIN